MGVWWRRIAGEGRGRFEPPAARCRSRVGRAAAAGWEGAALLLNNFLAVANNRMHSSQHHVMIAADRDRCRPLSQKKEKKKQRERREADLLSLTPTCGV